MVESPTRHESWRMFDRIARRYDLLNRLLSFGRDVAWRKQVTEFLPEGDRLQLLDLATGTTDLLISVCHGSGRIENATGLDMAEKMLRVGQKKIVRERLNDKSSLVRSDAQSLPFTDNSFNAITIAFGIRNIPDVPKALREMTRVLKPDGRAIILEFSLPKNRLMKRLYLFYFRHILPRVGSLISGDAYAYRYLNQTVESFPYGQEFCSMMEEGGMKIVGLKELTFGVASIYTGEKPATKLFGSGKRD